MLQEKNKTKLENKMQELYKEKFPQKSLPKTLNQLSKDLLIYYPECILLKIVEIKTFNEKPETELDESFTDNYFLDEDDDFKEDIYGFLQNNFKNFENNELVVKGITNIIKNLKPNSLIRKFISLIDLLTKNFNEENKLLCELLASNPLKYKELVYLVVSNLSISPLPKNAKDFYALNNYNNNCEQFTKFSKKRDSNEDLRAEILGKIDSLSKQIALQGQTIASHEQTIASHEQTIASHGQTLASHEQTIASHGQTLASLGQILIELQKEVIKLREESNARKEALFYIQVRDVIKAFVETLSTSLHINNMNYNVSDFEGALKSITNNRNEGFKMVINLIENIFKWKNSDDDFKNYINNKRFKEILLPDEIKEKYDKLKLKENCGIKNCDCIALILSIKEINDDSKFEATKKKYEFFDKLFNISWKDWNQNKKNVEKLLDSYKE